MKIQKIKTISYVLSKKMEGYHLLKNPNGRSPLEVRMIKATSHINEYGDMYCNYAQVTRTTNKNKTKEQFSYLSVQRYYNPYLKKYMKQNDSILIRPTIGTCGHSVVNCNFMNERKELSQKELSELRIKVEMDNKPCSARTNKPNFFKVLYHNITNK